MDKTKIIVLTDGDSMAQKAVEVAGKQLDLRTISASAGNPTPLSGEELIALIQKASHDPVLVMVDDCGNPGYGKGEHVLEFLGTHPEIEILGVIAVAANCQSVDGIKVDFSVDQTGKVVEGPVDKDGRSEAIGHRYIEGDTVDILNGMHIPMIVGIGDIGKMHGLDSYKNGAHVTTKAVQEILNRSGLYEKATH